LLETPMIFAGISLVEALGAIHFLRHALTEPSAASFCFSRLSSCPIPGTTGRSRKCWEIPRHLLIKRSTWCIMVSYTRALLLIFSLCWPCIPNRNRSSRGQGAKGLLFWILFVLQTSKQNSNWAKRNQLRHWKTQFGTCCNILWDTRGWICGTAIAIALLRRLGRSGPNPVALFLKSRFGSWEFTRRNSISLTNYSWGSTIVIIPFRTVCNVCMSNGKPYKGDGCSTNHDWYVAPVPYVKCESHMGSLESLSHWEVWQRVKW
jgi:hypothetical protein